MLTRGGAGSKRLKVDRSGVIMRGVCDELLAIFDGANPAHNAPSPRSPHSPHSPHSLPPPLEDARAGGSEGSYEMEILRQEEGEGAASPVAVTAAAFHSSSSERGAPLREREGEGEGSEGGLVGLEGLGDDANFLGGNVDFFIPPTDEMELPETGEGPFFGRGVLGERERQYGNIDFEPLRLPTQDALVESGGFGSQAHTTQYYRAESISNRVLDFFAREATQGAADGDDGGEGGEVDFAACMRTHGVGRQDVARVFFHALVLHSKAHIRMGQAEDLAIRITVHAQA